MSIAELFESGERKQDKGHYRNLVLLARIDGGISEVEQQLLTRIGSRLGLSSAQIDEITENPERYPITPPSGKEERIERFVQLCEMVTVDGNVAESEKHVIRRIAVALGFNDNNFETFFNQVVNMFLDGKSRIQILEELN